jgi:hypothetical protein
MPDADARQPVADLGDVSEGRGVSVASARTWPESAAVVRCRTEAPFPPLQSSHLLFNASLMPYAAHPLVRERGTMARQQLSARRLADYLNKTERVELHIVNRAVEQMLGLEPGVSVGRDDLLAVYTDEGFHTWMMARFRERLHATTGVALPQAPSPSIARVLALCEAVPPTRRGLAMIAAATVTETLITGTLRRAGAGNEIYPPVGVLLAEHAADEMRHQAAFVRFASAWVPSLSSEERECLDDLLPELMSAFLAPELALWREHLCAIGLDGDEADRVLRESVDPLEVAAQMMTAALVPRRLFERLGLSCADRFARLANRWRPP